MFWAISALLSSFALIYLFYWIQKSDIERKNKTSLYKKLVRLLIMAFLPIASLSLYLYLGKFEMPDFPYHSRQDIKQIDLPEEISELPLETIIHKVKLKLKNDPNDIKGYLVLAQIYAQIGEFGQSIENYEKTFHLGHMKIEDYSQLWGDYAEVLVLNNDQQINQMAYDIFSQILEVTPDDHRALFFRAAYAYQHQYFKKIDALCSNFNSPIQPNIWTSRIDMLCQILYPQTLNKLLY